MGTDDGAEVVHEGLGPGCQPPHGAVRQHDPVLARPRLRPRVLRAGSARDPAGVVGMQAIEEAIQLRLELLGLEAPESVELVGPYPRSSRGIDGPASEVGKPLCLRHAVLALPERSRGPSPLLTEDGMTGRTGAGVRPRGPDVRMSAWRSQPGLTSRRRGTPPERHRPGGSVQEVHLYQFVGFSRQCCGQATSRERR